tara:strand:- start:267 stop:476 length:210 start_codon:yes stop_codon:yes gene_type:complete
MKYLIIILIIIFSKINLAFANNDCDGVLAKLKSECNIVGKSLEKMRDFSEKNKTIDQSFKNIKEKFKKD